jgi:high-affinity iron transporter
MIAAFLILLREGIEASLLVGIIAAYLRQTGRAAFMPLVWIGIACGVDAARRHADGAGERVLADAQRQQEFFEAAVGLVAVGVLTAMVFWMRRAARSIRVTLHERIDAALGSGGAIALAAMVFFAVAREALHQRDRGLAVLQHDGGWPVALGAVLGLMAAIAIGFAIAWGGVRLRLAWFFRWSGVFLLIVAAGLLAGALRSLHEAGVWNRWQAPAFDMSDTLPQDGFAGALLSGLFGYAERPSQGELLAYLLFLAITLPLFLRPVQVPAADTRVISNA